MFKIGRRTKGKLKVDIGLKDFYAEYKREAKIKDRTPVSYEVFSKAIKLFNTKISERVVYKCESYKMPYRLGLLGVIKFEQKFDPDKKYKWAIDWKTSKEHNQIIYFENSDRYKWRWDKSYTRFKGKKYYAFKATKQNKILIKTAKQENPKLDFYSKLAP